MKIALRQRWSDRKQGERGILRVEVETTIPRRVLLSTPWLSEAVNPELGGVAEKRYGAQEMLGVALRVLRFLDLTGARPRKNGWRWCCLPAGDHVSYWLDRDGTPFMTTEHYPNDLPQEGDFPGLTRLQLPREIGLWNPPHTTLFLVTYPEHGEALQRVQEILLSGFRFDPPAFVEE